MFIETIQDPDLRVRIELLRDEVPRNPDNGKPVRNRATAEIMREFFRRDDMICLPPDNVIPKKWKSVPLSDRVRPSRILEHLITHARHRRLLKFCLCREIMGCRHYPIDLGCLLLSNTPFNIHPDLGRSVNAKEAFAHTRKASASGLTHCVSRIRIDSLLGNPEQEINVLCICNTCACCCLDRPVSHADPDSTQTVSLLPGLRMLVNDYCIGCGTCVGVDVCPAGAIRMQDGRAWIDHECRFCGRCIRECPVSAIELIIHDDDFVDRAVQQLNAVLDAP